MKLTHALAPLSLLYGAAVRARLALFRRGILKAARIPAPVISVGNITAGGTGKTPLVAWLARALAREGLKPCVLTRGYGREREGERVVVSDREQILADARRGGDEPRLLAEQLLGVASVVADSDRAGAAHFALERLSTEVFILDDGFQHLKLARDLDIVTIDATNPWGGGRLLPRGLLREPTQNLSRAGCVVITRSDLAQDIEELRTQIKRLTKAPLFSSRMKTTRVRPLHPNNDSDEGLILPHPAAAFCATGNPQAFFAHLRNDGHTLNYTRAFRDHHVYTQDDLDTICREAEARGARSLVTTAKDAVKLHALRATLPLFVVEINLEIDVEQEFLSLLRKTISRRDDAQ